MVIKADTRSLDSSSNGKEEEEDDRHSSEPNLSQLHDFPPDLHAANKGQ